MKVSIPLVIAANGEIQTGSFSVAADGSVRKDSDFAIDCLSAPGYMQFVVVHVEAEIDIAGLFPERTVRGTVNREHG